MATFEDVARLAREHLGLDDRECLAVVLAAGVSTADETNDRLWPMLIGSPSGGKTTLLSLLNKLDHEDVDDLTPASLLYYEPPTKPGQPGRILGILPRSDAHGLLIIKDFSPILATSNAGLRDVLFGYLRGAYDGSLNRAIATSPVRLTWSGRLTIVAACTPAIENYSIYQGELGPRFSYCRLAERTIAERRRLLNGSRSLSQDRKPAQEATKELVEHARSELPFMALTNATHDLLDDLSIISAYGRTSIARDYRHDVNGDPDTEMSFRFRNQLDILGRSCLALGLSTAEVERTCTRLALDSIPSQRRKVLQALSSAGTELRVAELAHQIGGRTNWTVLKRTLEDLELSGMVWQEEGEKFPCWGLVDTFVPLLQNAFASSVTFRGV